MTLRQVFVEWPAKAWNVWWTAYGVVLTVLIMIVVTVTLIAILLDLVFGIRWGW